MASTVDRLKKAMRVSDKRKEQRDEYAEKRRGKQSSESVALMEDLNDYDRYNSAGGERKIPYERQREMVVKKLQQPKGPSIKADEAFQKAREVRRETLRKKKW